MVKIDRKEGTRKTVGGEQSGKSMVEVERFDSSDLRQERTNACPDLQHTGSTNLALML